MKNSTLRFALAVFLIVPSADGCEVPLASGRTAVCSVVAPARAASM